MKLRCPKGCKTKMRGKFYRGWYVNFLYDSKGKELKLDDTSWEHYDKSYRCRLCHEPAVEEK